MIIANKAHEYETLASNIEELTFNYLKEKLLELEEYISNKRW